MNRTDIDRRPRNKVGAYSGNYGHHPLGFEPGFADDATCGSYVANLILARWHDGYRRFTINRPGGCAIKNTSLGTACWDIYSTVRKASIINQLAPVWLPLKAQGGELDLYGGWNTPDDHDAANPCLGEWSADQGGLCPNMAGYPHHSPDLDDPDDAAFWHTSLDPWVVQVGVRSYGADNTDPFGKRAAFLAWAAQMNAGFIGGVPVKCAMEGIPFALPGHLPDPAVIGLAPSCAIGDFVLSHEGDSGQEWSVDPFTTEVHILIRDLEQNDVALFKRWLRAGFILDDWRGPGYYDGKIVELTRANEVQSLAATVDGEDIDVVWGAPLPLVEYDNVTPIAVKVYEVCRGQTNLGPWTPVADTSSTSYTDTPPDGTWYYRVRVWTEYNATGDGSVVLAEIVEGPGDPPAPDQQLPYRPRLAVLQAAVAAAAGIDGGRFAVNRGPVNWTTWNWDEHPFACVIEFSNFDLFPPAGEMFHTGNMEIAFVTRPPKADGVRGINDGAVDRLAADAELFLHRLLGARRPDGSPVVARLVDSDPPEVREFPGPDYNLSGVELSVTVEY